MPGNIFGYLITFHTFTIIKNNKMIVTKSFKIPGKNISLIGVSVSDNGDTLEIIIEVDEPDLVSEDDQREISSSELQKAFNEAIKNIDKPIVTKESLRTCMQLIFRKEKAIHRQLVINKMKLMLGATEDQIAGNCGYLFEAIVMLNFVKSKGDLITPGENLYPSVEAMEDAPF